MEKIRLDILGISYSQTQSGAYALILAESKGKRRLPIIIGGYEAQAIAIELEKMKPSRPLTHDLFKNFAEEFKIHIYEVIIHTFTEGVFYSKLICEGPDKMVELDSRTSDAVALAVRFNCPIFTNEEVMQAAGIVLDESNADELEEEAILQEQPQPVMEPVISEFEDYTITELEKMLDDAINNEEYEKASRYRDEIKKRKGSNL